MPKAQDYHLSAEELKEIEKAIKHDKRPEVVQRSMAIRLLHLGNKPEKVAQMQAVSKPTISQVIPSKRKKIQTQMHAALTSWIMTTSSSGKNQWIKGSGYRTKMTPKPKKT